MSSLYIDGTFRISQEILNLRHSIQKAVHQHGFFRYEQQSRSPQPLTSLRELLRNPRRYQQLHSHFCLAKVFISSIAMSRASLIYFHKRQHDRRQRHEQKQKITNDIRAHNRFSIDDIDILNNFFSLNCRRCCYNHTLFPPI